MLLNSNTAIRSFRELQYDLKELLRVVSAVNPEQGIGTPDNDDIVIAKWSDGSVSMVVAFSVISAMVGNTFPSLNIAGNEFSPVMELVTISASGGKKEIPTLQVKTTTGLSIRILDMSNDGDTVTFINSLISRISANYVTLSDDVLIYRLDMSGDVSAVTLKVLSDLIVRNDLATDRVIADTVDLSEADCGALDTVYIPTKVVYLSSIYHFSKSDMPFCDMGYILDNLYFNGDMPASDKYIEFKNVSITVSAPSQGGRSIVKPVNTIELSYSELYEMLPLSSTASIVTLYPMKSVDVDGSNFNIKLTYPTSETNYRLSRIENRSDKDIRLCNGWKFTTAFDFLHTIVEPITYIVIPAYSAVDFVFYSEVTSTDITAFMMPTRRLVEDING